MSEPAKPTPAPAAPAPPPAPLGSEPDSALWWDRVRKRPVPLIGVAFTVPVFLAYHLGILWLQRVHQEDVQRSGFDFVSSWLLRLIEVSEPAYVLLTLVLSLVLLIAAWVHQKRGKNIESPFKRVLLESLGFAVLALGALGWVTHEVLQGEASSLRSLPLLDRVVLAIGSASHEELVFRALLISGGSWVLVKVLKMKRMWLVTALCTLLSSVLLALTQYVLIAGAPFSWDAIGCRVLVGLFFAVLFLARGFAVVVYTHTFFNLITLFWYF